MKTIVAGPLFALLCLSQAACGGNQKTLSPAETPFSPTPPTLTATGINPPTISQTQPISQTQLPTQTTKPTSVPLTTTPPPPTTALRRINWIDEEVGWTTAGNPWRFVKTEDGGQIWLDVTPDELIIASDRVSGSTLAPDRLNAWNIMGNGAAENRTLYRTSDGGTTWAASPANIEPAMGYRLHFWDTKNGCATVQGSCGAGVCGETLYRTSDGGESWAQITPSQPDEKTFGFRVLEGGAIFYEE
jgi:hypothetical protein